MSENGVSEGAETQVAKSLVIGGTGIVGSYIVEHLIRAGEQPLALSRSPRSKPGVVWFQGDLKNPGTLKFPPFTKLYCTADAMMMPAALPHLFNASLKRIVLFSSTSVLTKTDSEIVAERQMWQDLAETEQKIVAACEQRNIEWTILRPTLVYAEGRDQNITPLSRLIERFGIMPAVGGATGLRQPVHAEDLAIGAIAAASSASAANKFYSLPGGETLTYREMVGRIFDALRLPRRTIPVPAFLWRAVFAFVKRLFPGVNVAMGTRMMKDMAFDCTPAKQDFGWNPRMFHPTFDKARR